MKSPPTVTAVMVTGHDEHRRPMALLTARDFVHQTYPHAELLIINQGQRPLLTEPVDRVREVMDGAGLVVGALRNVAWHYASGELMACWDDDDVHHPQRLATQVAHYRNSRPVALRSELVLHLASGGAFVSFRWDGYENSLLWPRDCEARYSERRRGSDAAFAYRLRKERGGVIIIDNPPSLYVRIFHGRNIWGEQHFRQLPYDRNPNDDERRLLDELLPRYREAAG